MKTIHLSGLVGYQKHPYFDGPDTMNPLKTIAAFFNSRSLRSRELLWDLFTAALSRADENLIGHQAVEWALFYRQLENLMEATGQLNRAWGPDISLVAVHLYYRQ